MKNLKNLSKRGFALFLALVMCLGMLNMAALADTIDETNENVVWTENAGEETMTPDDTAFETTETPDEPSESAEDAPVESEPVENEPVEGGPVETEPVENEPVEGEPPENEPVEGEPVESEPVESEPVENEPVENEPTESEAVDVDTPSAEALTFLAAVAALPETVTEANAQEVLALVEAAEAAYGALPDEDLAREDVNAAVLRMAVLMETAMTLAEEQDSFGELKAAIETANNANEPITVEVNDTIEVTETLTISGNVILTGGTLLRAKDMTGALVNVTGTLTLKDVTLDGNRDNVTAKAPLITVKSGASLTVDSGAVLENNNNNSRSTYGGAINNMGTLTMQGGTIQNNRACESGGGVYNIAGTFVMTNGEITSNTSECDAGGALRIDSTGGGVCVATGTMEMSGGTISYNSAIGRVPFGGGIALGDTYDSHRGAKLTMTGGTIEGNISNGCGGGIAVWSYQEATITGGNIINNRSNVDNAYWAYSYYGGGGIYINQQGKLTLKNVEIANNEANLGGGLAACPTSDVHLYIKNGGVFYGNTTTFNCAIDGDQPLFVGTGKDIMINGKASNVPVSITSYTMNGYRYNWTNVNGELAGADELNCILDHAMLLNSGLTTEQGQRAGSLCSVHITGNVSGGETERSYGGGIGCNGTLIIGEDTTNMVLEKKVDGTVDAQDEVFDFTLVFKVDEDTSWTGDITLLQNGNSSTATTNEDGELSLTLKAGEYVVLAGLPVGVTYTITEGANLADKVTITHTTTAGLDLLSPEANTEEIDGDEINGDIVAGTLNEVLYTNTYNTEYTSVTVNKVWSDGSDIHVDGFVIVDVLDAANEVVRTVTLNAENGWTATVKGLSADGEYHVVERTVNGYTPTYTENVDGSITITNTSTPVTPPPTPTPTPTPDPDPDPTPDPTPEPTPDPEPEPEEPEVPEEPEEPEEPDEEVEEPDVPLANLPEEPEEEIPDEDVPLADAPETGDDMGLWLAAAAMSAMGLMAVLGKHKEDEEA